MNSKKYRIEKVLHELIRDLPEVARINKAYENGLICYTEMFKEIGKELERIMLEDD